jgi:hypothetical protein
MRPTDSAQLHIEQLTDASLRDLERVRRNVRKVFQRARDDDAFPLKAQSFDPTGRPKGGHADPTLDAAIGSRPDHLREDFAKWVDLARELSRKSYEWLQLTQRLTGLEHSVAKDMAEREHLRLGRCAKCGKGSIPAERRGTLCDACRKAEERARKREGAA